LIPKETEAGSISGSRDSLPPGPHGLASFDSRLVILLAPVLVSAAAILVRMSPLGFLLEGLHIWIHELGHASVSWLSARPAVPLPFGWTNVQPYKSPLLYAVILLGLGALAFAGWRERTTWAIGFASALACLQGYMTWRLSENDEHLWMIFGGVGGEFYISAAMVALFFVELPDWFCWGRCRYAVLFIGAASFYETYSFWRKVRRGLEGIPYGSMINGEDDGGGDMNILHDDYGWSQHRIIHAYSHLGDACVAGLLAVYLFYGLRLNRLIHPVLLRAFPVGGADGR
jgi:hypothetical protein